MTWDWLMLLGLAAIVFVQSLLTWTIRADAFADKVDLSQLHAWLIYLETDNENLRQAEMFKWA